MTHIRIVVTETVEYDADPDNYPDPSPEKMLKVDVENVKNDRSLMEALGAKRTVIGTLI